MADGGDQEKEAAVQELEAILAAAKYRGIFHEVGAKAMYGAKGRPAAGWVGRHRGSLARNPAGCWAPASEEERGPARLGCCP